MPDVQPTNNPVPSDNPADARDNFKRIDEVVNSTENLTSPTRTGVQLVTLHRYNELVQPNIDGAEAAAVSAAASAAAAEAAVSGLDYQGLWPGTGGSANKGDTYQTQVSGTPTGQYFTALQNTTIDPVGDNVNWREVVSNQSIDGLTNYQAATVADMIAGRPVGWQSGDPVISHVIGQVWGLTGKFKVVSISNPMTIDNFDALGDVFASDFGVIFDNTTDIYPGTMAAISALKNIEYNISGGGKYASQQKLIFPFGRGRTSSGIPVKLAFNYEGNGSIVLPMEGSEGNFDGLISDPSTANSPFIGSLDGIDFQGFRKNIALNNDNINSSKIVFKNLTLSLATEFDAEIECQSSIIEFDNVKFRASKKILKQIKCDKLNLNNCWMQPADTTELNYSPVELDDGLLSIENTIGVPNIRPDVSTDEPAWISQLGLSRLTIGDGCRFGGEGGGMTLVNVNSAYTDATYTNIHDCFAAIRQEGSNPTPTDKLISCVRITGHYPRHISICNMETSTNTQLIGFSSSLDPSSLDSVTIGDRRDFLPSIDVQGMPSTVKIMNDSDRESVGRLYDQFNAIQRVPYKSGIDLQYGRMDGITNASTPYFDVEVELLKRSRDRTSTFLVSVNVVSSTASSTYQGRVVLLMSMIGYNNGTDGPVYKLVANKLMDFRGGDTSTIEDQPVNLEFTSGGLSDKSEVLPSYFADGHTFDTVRFLFPTASNVINYDIRGIDDFIPLL